MKARLHFRPTSLNGYPTVHGSYMVLGEAKSGTTALFTSVNASVPDPKETFFEPVSLQPVGDALSTANVVAKVLVGQIKVDQVEIIEHFAKVLMIIRDPRDTLVSRLLYQVREMKFIHHPGKVARFMTALHEKESDPSSWSLIGLYELLSDISGGEDRLPIYASLHNKTVDLARRLSGHAHVLLYEDFVADVTDAADRYIGFSVSSRVEVDSTYRRVTRTKGSGDWKNWFTAEDESYAREEYARYLDHFGYTAWDRAEPPSVDPATASEYVTNIIQMKLNRTG